MNILNFSMVHYIHSNDCGRGHKICTMKANLNAHPLCPDITDIRRWRRAHIIPDEVVHMVRLDVPLQSHGVAIRRVVRQRIQADVRRLVSSEDEKLRVLFIGDNHLFTPVPQDITVEGRIRSVGSNTAVVPNLEDPADVFTLWVPFLKLAVVEEFQELIPVPEQAQMRPRLVLRV